MVAVSGSEVYWDILFVQGLPSMVMGGRFKAGIPKSTEKVLLNQ